jgi:tetratricopeptide (TPR) repeat protein
MNLLQNTRSLNNQGVELLVSGKSSEASKTFKLALQLLASDEEAKYETDGERYDEKVNEEVPELDLSQSLSVVPDLQADHFFVYNQAITIMEATVTNVNDEAISQHSYAILFNLALCFHREGMLGSKKLLVKAAFLYAKCLQILSLDVTANSEQIPSSTVLAVVALNNQAQIHHELSEHSNALSCMAQVTSMLKRTPSLKCFTLSLKKALEEILLNTKLSSSAM